MLGDQAAASRIAATRARLAERLRPARDEPYDNGFDAYYGNQCADTEYPRTLAAFSAIGRYAEAGSRFGPYWWWFNAPCANWPTAPDRYVGPWTARTSAPVLVVGNYFDGVTDYAGAQASARLLRNSRLLSYAGGGTPRTAAALAPPTTSTRTCSPAPCRRAARCARPTRTRSSPPPPPAPPARRRRLWRRRRGR